MGVNNSSTSSTEFVYFSMMSLYQDISLYLGNFTGDMLFEEHIFQDNLPLFDVYEEVQISPDGTRLYAAHNTSNGISVSGGSVRSYTLNESHVPTFQSVLFGGPSSLQLIRTLEVSPQSQKVYFIVHDQTIQGPPKLYSQDVALSAPLSFVSAVTKGTSIRRLNDQKLYFQSVDNANINGQYTSISNADATWSSSNVTLFAASNWLGTRWASGFFATQPHRLYPNKGLHHRLVGEKLYELTDHLGNVRTTITDRKIATFDSNWAITGYTADITSANDYYPFGSPMPKRQYNPGEYRYGFNGHEKVDEVSGSGNTIDMGDRWLDVRLGRTPKIDRQANKFSGISPYSYALNNPIIFIDPDGEYPISIHVRSFAPFNSFGPGNLWKGDGSNRSFTSNTAGSRISMATNYETETQVANSTAYGAMSISRYGAYAYSDAYLNDGQRNVTSTGNNLNLHLYGKLEAVIPNIPGASSPGGRMSPTWDIDVHTNLSIDASDGVLSISGQIRGDQFPSAEAFVSDDCGTSIMLGTFATSGGRQLGPIKDLAGDRDLPMMDVNIKLSVGEDGAFQGVYSTDSKGNEIIMSPDAHNKQHERKSTTR